jgi:hypothetical protein
MDIQRIAVAAVLLVPALCAAAAAQSGVLDQSSPYGSGPPQQTLLDLDQPGVIWQQEVQAGLNGLLEGIQLRLSGPVGAQVTLRVRQGAGWNTLQPSFTVLLSKQQLGLEQFFVDCSIAQIPQAPGTLFVFDLEGNGSGCAVFATYTPPPAAALYPRFLFRNGPGCYTDCGTRIGFRTYVVGSPTQGVYCVAKTNSLSCTPSIGSLGTPSASATSGFTIRAQQVRNNKVGLLIYGTNGRANSPFQGGTLCVQPPIKRSIAVQSGGTPAPANDCTGVYALDMNAFARGLLGGAPIPLLSSSGTAVNTQYWGRDPGFPTPFDSTLSDGFEYVVP